MSGSLGFKRNAAFLFLFGIGFGFTYLLKPLGVPGDIRFALLFLPILVLLILNRASSRDRLYGMGFPTTVFAAFVSLSGFTAGKEGFIFEVAKTVALIGVCISLGWVIALIFTMLGASRSEAKARAEDSRDNRP